MVEGNVSGWAEKGEGWGMRKPLCALEKVMKIFSDLNIIGKFKSLGLVAEPISG